MYFLCKIRKRWASAGFGCGGTGWRLLRRQPQKAGWTPASCAPVIPATVDQTGLLPTPTRYKMREDRTCPQSPVLGSPRRCSPWLSVSHVSHPTPPHSTPVHPTTPPSSPQHNTPLIHHSFRPHKIYPPRHPSSLTQSTSSPFPSACPAVVPAEPRPPRPLPRYPRHPVVRRQAGGGGHGGL